MARKTAGTAAAPSPADKEKAGANKPAKAAAKPVEASKPAPESKAAASPAEPEEKGTADATITDGVTLPAVVAAAVSAMAAAGGKGPGEEPDDSAEEGVTVEPELFVFSVPVVTDFPVVLTLTNAWPGRHDVAGTNETLAPGETRAVEFDEKGYARFAKQITQLADLHAWTEGQGILIEQGEQDAED